MDYTLNNVLIEYMYGQYTLTDKETNQVAVGDSIDEALDELLQKNEVYWEQPEVVEKKQQDRAKALLENMLRDETVMAMVLVGLISADSNCTKSEIEKNRRMLQWLKKGLNDIEPKEEQKERFDTIAGMIDSGIEILDRDVVTVPAEELLENLLGSRLYKMRSLFALYFDKDCVSRESRDKYIYETFGECKEPTYDPLWKVWYLGHYAQNGDLYYSLGSAQEILGEYLDCRIGGTVSMYQKGESQEKEASGCISGSVDFLLGEAWRCRKYEKVLEFDDLDLLSEKQKELLRKIQEK